MFTYIQFWVYMYLLLRGEIFFFDFYYMFHAPTTEIWTFELKSYSRPPIWEPVDCWVRTAGLGWKLNLARFGTLGGQENFAQWFIHTWQSIVIREID